MSDESSYAFKIRRAPSGKFYIRQHGEVVCLSTGNLRYFETEREAWMFLADCGRAETDRFAA
jgi:hypothetical protein